MKRETYVYIFGILLTISIAIPIILIFQATIETPEDEETTHDSPEDFPNPDTLYKNITAFTINSGKGAVYNGDLDSLKFLDGDDLEITPTWINPYYEVDIEFEINNGYDLNSHAIDEYDYYLFLQIDLPPELTQELYFQKYTIIGTTWQWVNITTIKNTITDMNRTFCERTLKYRIVGAINTDLKVVSIDRIRVIKAHSGSMSPNFQSTIWYAVNEHESHSGNLDWDWSNPSNWWVYDDSTVFKHKARDRDTSCPNFNVEARIESHWRFYWNAYFHDGTPTTSQTFSGNIIYWWDEYVEAKYEYSCQDYCSHTGFGEDIYMQTSIYDSSSGWEQIDKHGGDGDEEDDFTAEVNADRNDRFRSSSDYSFKLRFKGKTESHETWSCSDWDGMKKYRSKTHIEVDKVYASMSFKGYGFQDFDYPDIHIYTNPSSNYPDDPISTLEEFDLLVDTQSQWKTYGVASVEYMVVNETGATDWLPMTYDSQSGSGKSAYLTYKKTFNQETLGQGEYQIWIRTTDTTGKTTIKPFDLKVYNARPRITINNPKEENEKVSQLYNYNINISVEDPELEPFSNVSFRMYPLDDEANPIINWTAMEQYNYPVLDWNYSINPIDYENGFYTLQFRANDSLGYGYNEIDIWIINEPPDIEIVQPIETTLTKPLNRTILVNITNEEPLISAQWDITQTIDSYNWKNLTYNATADLWYANFSLLEYEYGNWYLVINATDDKYNESIKIKEYQFQPFITYYKNIEDIGIKSEGLNVYINPAKTDNLDAVMTINHHEIAQERDWEVYIPNNFTDAHEYIMYRGFATYEPLGFNVEGIHTIWKTSDSAPVDIINFKLQKPILDNELIEEDETEDDLQILSLEFSIFTKHELANIIIHNTLEKYLPNPQDYEYTLEFQFQSKWFEIKDYDLTIGATPSFSFVWGEIEANQTITFRFIAEEQIIEESPIGIWFLIGGLIGGVAVFFYGIYANYRGLWSESKAKTILYGLLAFGIGFGGGFGIGYMLAPPTAFIF
jgi:hypothetical protein